MIIILDTSIILASLLTKKESNTRQILKLLANKDITCAISIETLSELKNKLSSSKIKEHTNYNNRIVANFINFYQHSTRKFKLHVQSSIVSRDPSDNIFLQLALSSKADYLLSGDKDLLVLKQIEKTIICTPKTFIQTVI